MGHDRDGELRPPAPALLPRHRRHPHVLLRGLTRLSREHPREVDARGEALLPQCSHYPDREQEGPDLRNNSDTVREKCLNLNNFVV